MGHYTAFGVAGRVHPRYRSLVQRWITTPPGPGDESRYHQLYKLVSSEVYGGVLDFFEGSGPPILRDLQEYMKDKRGDYIPFGKVEQSLAGFRGDWIQVRHCDVVTGWLVFTCALKNSDQTIEKWLRLVGHHLLESFEIVQVEYDPDLLGVGATLTVDHCGIVTRQEWQESEPGFHGPLTSGEFPHLWFQYGFPVLKEQA